MKTVNHIALVLDRSTSTRGIAPSVIKQFNQQVEFINLKSKEAGQQTFVSLYTFSAEADRPLMFEVPLSLASLKPLTPEAYKIEGNTALLDSVGLVVEDFSYFTRSVDHKTENHSFLVVILTDGRENASLKYNETNFPKLLKEKTRTDTWSFAFLVPKGDKANLVNRFGVEAGNVQEWDTSEIGLKKAGDQTIQGLSNYFTIRSSGKKATRSFFVPDLNVTTVKLKKELEEVTKDFAPYTVPDIDTYGEFEIRNFVEEYYGPYVKGDAFYELTKLEKVQPRKEVIVQNIHSGKLYSGDSARNLLNISATETIKVKPAEHKNFKIFIQSTSVNRHLVPSTTVLVRKQKANAAY